MRRNLLASTALTTSTLVTGAALAANLPLKAPPAPAVIPFSWTGCYVGLNAGGAATSIDHSLAVPPVETGFGTLGSSGRESSFIGGGQLGCNWQFDPKWVLGLEGDFNWLKAKRSQNFAFGQASTPTTFSDEDSVASLGTSLRWLSTIRARFGYAWERSLLYATGGLAIGRVTSSASMNLDVGDTTSGAIFSGSSSTTRTGWVAGLGYAYAFTDRLSGKLEYLHFDLGNASYNVNLISGSADFTTMTATTRVSGDIFRVGLDYKFYP
jgi:outer membrane immunogenic protein